jgi:hypothetical protein
MPRRIAGDCEASVTSQSTCGDVMRIAAAALAKRASRVPQQHILRPIG